MVGIKGPDAFQGLIICTLMSRQHKNLLVALNNLNNFLSFYLGGDKYLIILIQVNNSSNPQISEHS